MSWVKYTVLTVATERYRWFQVCILTVCTFRDRFTYSDRCVQGLVALPLRSTESLPDDVSHPACYSTWINLKIICKEKSETVFSVFNFGLKHDK